MIVTICGSSKFKDEIMKVARELTLQGHVVFTPCVFDFPKDKRMDRFNRSLYDPLCCRYAHGAFSRRGLF